MLKITAVRLMSIMVPSLFLTFQATNHIDEKVAEMKKEEEVVEVTEVKSETIEPPAEQTLIDIINMEVTGYTAGYESTGKHPGDPAYGQTTSGAYVEQGVTIAAGQNIPFGTEVYIPYFDGKPGFGDGVFTVQDRGGAIGAYNIDVYFESLFEAQEFGRQVLEVHIMEGN